MHLKMVLSPVTSVLTQDGYIPSDTCNAAPVELFEVGGAQKFKGLRRSIHGGLTDLKKVDSPYRRYWD